MELCYKSRFLKTGSYFVHVPKVIVKEDKNNIVHARMVENKKTSELELYCHSSAKEAKSKKMIDEVSARYEEELQKLSDGLAKKGCTKKYDKVMEKIGRLKEKYKKVNID